MAAWIPLSDGYVTLFTMVLTASDFVADPTPPIGHRGEKTIDVNGTSDANGFNGCTVQIHGDLSMSGTGHFKLLNSVPDTTDLSFTAALARSMTILANVNRIKPVITAGAPGVVGITIELLVTSPIARGGYR
jgi:hypothetical protein